MIIEDMGPESASNKPVTVEHKLPGDEEEYEEEYYEEEEEEEIDTIRKEESSSRAKLDEMSKLRQIVES